MQTVEQKELIKGGEFLIKDVNSAQIFIQEEFTEEQAMMAQACLDFLNKEIEPRLEEIDQAKSPELMRNLVKKAGELGLLATAVPAEYEGLGMSFNTSMLLADYVGMAHSFAVAFSAHTGIGTLPIVYYGNEEQKRKYLPKLASGEWISCYCLTEPDSGSDANSGKTRATLSAEGKHYIINGQKMWITNAGFADIFIVFAKIDDDKNLSAFIVEKGFGGITMNEPEKKLGIKGSDTRQVFFNDCHVPVENLLSERGNGFKIAVNILNIGRIKLAASCNGAAKKALEHSVRYAKERKQFNTAIANFGAIKEKIAKQATLIFVNESAYYRAGQNIDDCIEAFIANGMPEAEAKLKAFEQFAIECAIMKVFGSETLDYCVDEAVQIFGGMGYSAEAPVERCYRDSRINRIFEGTNEINRMLCVGTIVKRAMKGELNLMPAIMEVQKELMSGGGDLRFDNSFMSYEKAVLKNLKKATLMTAGAAVQKFTTNLQNEQEVMLNLADMLIQVYTLESAILRLEKLASIRGQASVAIQADMVRSFLLEAADTVYISGKNAINAFAEGEMHKALMGSLRKLSRTEAYNAKEARRRIADFILEQGKYPF
ncbi:MAG: acyl-CoA dehydrogenase family protein [Microscillaceae bacterium]|nr:acyl-CoA dehydrogenase family protein [Microscillaceae bacterium]MDW8461685.1 acyl-CoA dehydrogenase family protein [Cytophagales bacterium]